ncbi:MAG: MBL fold metallo-hydrolase [Deltaproteobacteria bacterium]|nr:MBL fold metallo-hydrolase [Deltaproteobacteria bacterium]
MDPRLPLRVLGRSVAGVETCIELPSLRVALDLGRCIKSTVACSTVLVSHGHLDHCGAVAQHAARRSLLGMEAARYVVPRPVVDAVQRVFDAHGALDGTVIPRTVVPLDPGEELALGPGRRVRAFRTDHRVVSQGYVITERRKRLRPEFAATPGPELGVLRRQGVVIEDEVTAPLLAFTGDTRMEALERDEEARRARVLVMEVSFLDDRVPVAQARELGHIHLDEVLPRADMFHNEVLVFSHFSDRYDAASVRAILAARLPEPLRDRVVPLL